MQAEAKVFPLEQFYLSILTQTINADSLDVLQQDLGNGAGRLWCVSKDTTVPVLHLAYRFDVDAVEFQLQTRDGRNLVRVVKYAEGLDAFVEEFQRFLRAGRLPSKVAARKAA